MQKTLIRQIRTLPRNAVVFSMASSLAMSAAMPAFADATVNDWGILFTGDYIQTGVNNFGTLGNENSFGEGVLYDGTGTGTFNSAYDYLAPGSPWEGFSINSGATQLINNNNDDWADATITDGVLTNYSGVAFNGTTFDNRAVWVGETTDFIITHDIYFNNTDQQINIETTLEAKTEQAEVYYLRTMDPDAVAADGDSSTTRNTIVSESGQNYVYGEALASLYVIGLLSSEANTVARVSDWWTNDAKTFYDGVDTSDFMASGTEADATIGLASSLGDFAIGDTSTLLYSYIFGTDIAAAIESAGGGGINVENTKVTIRSSVSASTAGMERLAGAIYGLSQSEVPIAINRGVGSVSISSNGSSSSIPEGQARFGFKFDLAKTDGTDDTEEKSLTRMTLGYAIDQDWNAGVSIMQTNFSTDTEFSYDGNVFGGGAYLRYGEFGQEGQSFKISGAFGRGSGTVIRSSALAGTEAGTGTADIETMNISAEYSYGFKSGDSMVSPFVRLNFSETTRAAYQETTEIGNPISYDEFKISSTSATVGAAVQYDVSKELQVYANGGIDFDLGRSADNITGTSTISGLESFDLAGPELINTSRAFAEIGARTFLTDTTNLNYSIGVTQNAYSSVNSVTLDVAFETRF